MSEEKIKKKVTEQRQEGELIRLDRMYEALRYNDYSIEGGLGEIVDNSIEAGAANIFVEIKQEKIRKEGEKRATDKITEIAIIDDGSGMNYTELRKCLTLGDSSRLAISGKRGIGRFGVGMTLGSISLARYIEVYSRTKADEEYLFTYIDLDAIRDRNLIRIPEPIKCKPDEKYAELIKKSRGTIVVLKNCDRVTSNMEGLANYLGRTYRKFIQAMLNIMLNGEKVNLHDPLYMAGPTMFDIKGQEPDKKAEPLGRIEKISLVIPNSGGEKADIIIRMSLLPKEWRLKQGDGRSEFANKRKIGQNEGISILRANREVLYGTVPFIIGKRGEASSLDIDRWWGCEISFPPELDEYFQIRYIKRGAEPVDSLRNQIRDLISEPVKAARNRISKDWTVQKADENKDTGIFDAAEDTMATINNILPKSKKGQNISKKDAEKKFEKIAALSNDNKPREEKTKELATKPYSIEMVSYPSNILFETEHILGSTIVKLNVNHPFYKKVLLPLCEPFYKENDIDLDENNYKTDIHNAILLLLFAYAKAEAMFDNTNELFEHFRMQWGAVLSTAINTQYERGGFQ